MYNPQITYIRIQQLATIQGISITELNEKCELSKNTISQSANSQEGMKAKKIFDISAILNCSADYLLGLTDNPNPTSATISNSNFNSGNISGDNIQAVNADENISKRDRQLLKQINSLDFQDYCKVMAYIGELIKK